MSEKSEETPKTEAVESPYLDFAGTTPYEDYVQADVLTHRALHLHPL